MSDATPTRTAPDADLTPRQREVLDLIARGLTNYEIAETLGVSLAGAKWHVSEVLSKLGVASREEAAQYWRRRNRPAARLQRFARALVAAPVMKVAGAAVLGSASVAALAMALPHGSGDTPAASDLSPTATAILAPEGSPGREDMTLEEASELAEAAAQRALEDTRLTDLDVYGEPLSVEHLILIQRGFQALATSAALGPSGQTPATPPPAADFWNFLYRLDGFAPPSGSNWASASVVVAVMIDDDRREVSIATAELRDGVEFGMTAAGDWSVPVVVTYLDDVDRVTVSLYGEPEAACVRVDDTSTPDARRDPDDMGCEARTLKHPHLYVADVLNAIGERASPIFVAVASTQVVRASIHYGDDTTDNVALCQQRAPMSITYSSSCSASKQGAAPPCSTASVPMGPYWEATRCSQTQAGTLRSSAPRALAVARPRCSRSRTAAAPTRSSSSSRPRHQS